MHIEREPIHCTFGTVSYFLSVTPDTRNDTNHFHRGYFVHIFWLPSSHVSPFLLGFSFLIACFSRLSLFLIGLCLLRCLQNRGFIWVRGQDFRPSLSENPFQKTGLPYWQSPWAHLHVVGMLRFMSDINQPSLPPPCCSVLVSVSIYMALSAVFYSINAPDNSPLSHSVLPVLFLLHCSFQLYISSWKSPSALI